MLRAGFIVLTPLFVIVSIVVSTVTPALASPASGLWRIGEDDALVEIYDCGGRICGRVVTSNEIAAHPDLKDFNNGNPSLRGRPVKGISVVSGFSGGPKSWSGGTLYRPQDGRSYSRPFGVDRRCQFAGDRLLDGLPCKTIWSRIK